MNKLLYFIVGMFLLNRVASQIPEIDWEQLQSTQPWKATEDWTQVSDISFSEKGIPSDALILFSGKDLDQWQQAQLPIPADMRQVAAVATLMRADYQGPPATWTVAEEGMAVKPGAGALATKSSFGDIQLHIEWLAPLREGKTGQHYSNSGIFLMGLYEIQILNSYRNSTYSNGQAGAIYKQKAPDVNASLPAGQWQTYDILFTAPVFDNNKKLVSPAFLTVIHNGVVIQNHVALQGPTVYIGESHYVEHAPRLPIVLQDHGDPVMFRNIWVREL